MVICPRPPALPLRLRRPRCQMLEVVFTVGNYTVLTMFHNSVGLPLEDGIKGLPD